MHAQSSWLKFACFSVGHVDQLIDEFMLEMKELLKNMTQDKFDTLVRQMPENTSICVGWTQILFYTGGVMRNFHRTHQEVLD